MKKANWFWFYYWSLCYLHWNLMLPTIFWTVIIGANNVNLSTGLPNLWIKIFVRSFRFSQKIKIVRVLVLGSLVEKVSIFGFSSFCKKSDGSGVRCGSEKNPSFIRFSTLFLIDSWFFWLCFGSNRPNWREQNKIKRNSSSKRDWN